MKKLLLVTVLFMNIEGATNEKDSAIQNIVAAIQAFQQTKIYAQLKTAYLAVDSFSYKYPAAITAALLLTCGDVPIYTKVFVGGWLVYQLLNSSSKSYPPGQK